MENLDNELEPKDLTSDDYPNWKPDDGQLLHGIEEESVNQSYQWPTGRPYENQLPNVVTPVGEGIKLDDEQMERINKIIEKGLKMFPTKKD